MFKDKREGWLKNLKVGNSVVLQQDETQRMGRVKTITPIGVFLIECEDGLKVKLEPTGKDLSGRISLIQK